MAEESFAETVDKVNGRLIGRMGPGGCYGWHVELRGPAWKDKRPERKGASSQAQKGPIASRRRRPLLNWRGRHLSP